MKFTLVAAVTDVAVTVVVVVHGFVFVFLLFLDFDGFLRSGRGRRRSVVAVVVIARLVVALLDLKYCYNVSF